MKLPDTCRNFAPVPKNVVGLSETPLGQLQSHLKPKPVEALGIVYLNKEYKPIHTLRLAKAKSTHGSQIASTGGNSPTETREKKRKVPANFRFNEPTEILAISSEDPPRNNQSRSSKRITLYKDIFWSKTAPKTQNLDVSETDDFTDKILDFIEAHPQESKLFLQSPGSLIEPQTFDFALSQKRHEPQPVIKLLPMPRFKSTVKVRKVSPEKKELNSSYLPSKSGYSPLRLTTGESITYLGRDGDLLNSNLPRTTMAAGKSDPRTQLWDNESIKGYDFERQNWIADPSSKKVREANQSLYKKMWSKINQVIEYKQLQEEKKLKTWNQRTPKDENIPSLLNSDLMNDYINEDDLARSPDSDHPRTMQQRINATPNRDFLSFINTLNEKKNNTHTHSHENKKMFLLNAPNTPVHGQRRSRIKVSSLLTGH